jgi:hypothetical protein
LLDYLPVESRVGQDHVRRKPDQLRRTSSCELGIARAPGIRSRSWALATIGSREHTEHYKDRGDLEVEWCKLWLTLVLIAGLVIGGLRWRRAMPVKRVASIPQQSRELFERFAGHALRWKAPRRARTVSTKTRRASDPSLSGLATSLGG